MTAAARVRVLVVDDSAFVRKVMRECLVSAGIDVVGVAQDGLEALEKIAELNPDVITLDLQMPNLDGLGVLRALAGRASPRVVIVSTLEGDSEAGIAALQGGAFELVHKPTALALAKLYEVGERLVEVVTAAGRAVPRAAPASPVKEPKRKARPITHELLVIGASTGGPRALTALIGALPANFPVPVAVVVHMLPGYTAAMASRLDKNCTLEVLEAAEGLELRPGRVILACAGQHLKLFRSDGQLRCKLDLFPIEALHRPSVDVLFASAADVVGAGTLGVVLTGMGDDGLLGARAIRAAGILTEAESSCVVYGMPREVMNAGLSAGEAEIDQMADAILRAL